MPKISQDPVLAQSIKPGRGGRGGGGGMSISTRTPFLTPDVFSLSTSKILDSLQLQMYS